MIAFLSKLSRLKQFTGRTDKKIFICVVIINHIALRNTLGFDRVAYLEYFYFVTYLAILYVSANSFLVARFADYNSERSKGMYFPAIFGALYVLTIMEFF